MTPGEALKTADLSSQLFCRAVANKIREVIPESSRVRFRLTVMVNGRNVRVDPQLRPYREERKDQSG